MFDKPLSQQIEEMHQDSIAGFSELSAKVDALSKNINSGQQQTQQNANQNNVKVFFKNAVKFYKYGGCFEEYKRNKLLVNFAFVAFVLLGVLATIITSISVGIYTTFTLLENVALIILLVFGVRFFNIGQESMDQKLSKASVFKYVLNKDNLFYPLNKNKGVIKLSNIFVILGVILNIIYIWVERSDLSIVATILEVLFCASELFLYFELSNFYDSYLMIIYKGKNVKGENVAIVQDLLLRKFFTLEEHKEKFSFLYK